MSTNPPGYLVSYYAVEREKIIRRLGNRCSRCGTSTDLEIHHIDNCNLGRGRGRLDRLTEWRRHFDNLQVLCMDCHNRLHIFGYGDD